MAHKKSSAGMSGGVPLSSLRDVNIPANPVPGAALSVTSTGEFGVLDYSQDYFTAKALEVIPPMGAVKMGPGGVLPKTSESEPTSPVVGVSVEGAAVGENAVVLRSGKIADKVFSPVNSVLRTLVDGTVGVGAAGTVVGTVDATGVGYVSIGSASSGGGSAELPKEGSAGSALLKKDDTTGTSLWGCFPEKLTTLRAGDIRVYHKDKVPSWAIALKSTEQSVPVGTYPELDIVSGASGDIITSVPSMTSNTAPAPYIASASSNTATAYQAFNGVLWKSAAGTAHRLDLSFGAEAGLADGFGIDADISTSVTYNLTFGGVIGGADTPLVKTITSTSNAMNPVFRLTDILSPTLLNKAGTATVPVTSLYASITFSKSATWTVRVNRVKLVRPGAVKIPAGNTYGDFVECIVHTTTPMTPAISAEQVGEVFLFPKDALPPHAMQLSSPLNITESAATALYSKFEDKYAPVSDVVTIPAPALTCPPHLVPAIISAQAVGAVGGAAISVSAEPGNILSEKPDGLFAQPKVSAVSGNLLEDTADGLYVGDGYQRIPAGRVFVTQKGTEHPDIVSMRDYNILKKAEYPDLLEAAGDWWYKYVQEINPVVTIPAMTSNTTPAPLVVSASSSQMAGKEAWRAFDGTMNNLWHSASGANQWVNIDLGKEYTVRGMQSGNAPTYGAKSATITMLNGAGSQVFSKNYTLSTASGMVNNITFIPGTTTDRDATINFIKNVRQIKFLNPADTYTAVSEIIYALYDNDAIPDRATYFVTNKEEHEDPDKEYFIALAPIKLTPEGTIAGGAAPIVLSSAAGNTLQNKPDGLFAQPKLSLDGGNALELKADGLYVPAGGSSGGVYDLVDGTVVKMPFKLNGKQVYAYRIPPFTGPSTSSLVDLPAAIPAFDNAWIDMQSSYYKINVHNASYHDTMAVCGDTWYVGVQIPERKLHTSGDLSNTSLCITLLFTRADGQ